MVREIPNPFSSERLPNSVGSGRRRLVEAKRKDRQAAAEDAKRRYSGAISATLYVAACGWGGKMEFEAAAGSGERLPGPPWRHATMKTKLWTILGVGIALAALIVEGRIATNREIAVLRTDMNERFEASRASMNESIAASRASTNESIAAPRASTNESIAALRRDFTSLRAGVASLRGEVSKLGERVANIEGRLDGWSLAVLGAQESRTVPDGESPPSGAPKLR